MSEAIEYNESIGLRRRQVAALQRLIGAEDDGRWGPKTIAALQEWQGAHGLAPDGFLGPSSQYEAGKTDPEILREYDSHGEPEKSPNPLITLAARKWAEERGCVLGIDLSHHNPEPDWKALWDAGIRVVIHKAWQSRIDPACISRLIAARSAAPFDLGIYGWIEPHKPPVPQVNLAIRTIDRINSILEGVGAGGPLNVPIGLDLERLYDASPKRAIGVLDDIRRALEDHGLRSMYYGGDYFHARKIAGLESSRFTTWRRWLAWYPEAGDFESFDGALRRSGEAWDGWQCTSQGAHPALVKGRRLARFDLTLWRPEALREMTGRGCSDG